MFICHLQCALLPIIMDTFTPNFSSCPYGNVYIVIYIVFDFRSITGWVVLCLYLYNTSQVKLSCQHIHINITP